MSSGWAARRSTNGRGASCAWPTPPRSRSARTDEAACGGSGRLARRAVVLAWGRGPVAAIGAPTVGAGGDGGPIRFEPQDPAPPVNDDQVVEGAQRHQVVQRGRASCRAGDQMVDLAHAGGLVAAGEGAVRVAGGGGAAQVGGDGGFG